MENEVFPLCSFVLFEALCEKRFRKQKSVNAQSPEEHEDERRIFSSCSFKFLLSIYPEELKRKCCSSENEVFPLCSFVRLESSCEKRFRRQKTVNSQSQEEHGDAR